MVIGTAAKIRSSTGLDSFTNIKEHGESLIEQSVPVSLALRVCARLTESHRYFLGSITHVLAFLLGFHFVDQCNNSSAWCSELITHRLACMTHLIPTVRI